jgi:hypothetical protein
MSSLATKKVLEKELRRFEERVVFLEDWINSLDESNTFEDEDKAYKLSIERDFKLNLISQRTKQIDQINNQDELKASAIKEFPSLILDAGNVVDQIESDVNQIRNTKSEKGESKKQRLEAIKNLLATKEQIETILKAIVNKFNDDENHPEILTDFRQLNEIKKILK